jgi:hypothetical protein
MTEMIERVARAIADAFMEDYSEAPNLYDEMAEAAIAAMREPTEAMIEAGRWPAEDDGPAACWQAMIGAALTPTKQD